MGAHLPEQVLDGLGQDYRLLRPRLTVQRHQPRVRPVPAGRAGHLPGGVAPLGQEILGPVGTLAQRDEGQQVPQPIAVADVQGKEGKSGTTAFTFVVSLSGKALAPVTVDYASAAGTASVPSDFQSVSGTLSFPVGVDTRTITVQVVGDRTRERNESFYVNLSNPSSNAYLGDGQALGTIVDDD